MSIRSTTHNPLSRDALPDGEACSLGSSSGFCLAGGCDDNPCASIDCDDGNPMTENLCDPFTGDCSNPGLAELTPCELEGVLGECMSAVCVGLCEDSATRCDDNNACTGDSCDPETGCVNTDLCNDGNPCTEDVCISPGTGTCQHGTCVSDIIIPPPILP